MHTQPESACEHRAAIASIPSIGSILSIATGLALYLLTLAGEVMLGAGVRWLLAYLGAATLGAIFPLGLSAEALAYAAAFAPLAWSVLGLLLPGRGWVWRWRLGARRPSAEEAVVIGDALASLRGQDAGLPEPASLWVLDDPLPGAAVRGRTLILQRALLDSDCLAAVFAHELGHLGTLDGRISEALERLELWDDPLRPLEEERWEPVEGRLLLACARWALRLAGGGCTKRLLGPLWAAHWRAREYAADAYAASLGQAEELARHLAEHELPFDAPRRRLLFNLAEHPPVALRIERLLASCEGRGSR